MKKKIKRAIILTITMAMFVLWCISVVAIDSATNIPLFAFIISTAWLFYFMWCNDWFKEW